MVSVTTRRPCSAARTPRAAASVVLPTPPDPQHTMIFVSRVGKQCLDIEVLSCGALLDEFGGQRVEAADVGGVEVGELVGRPAGRAQRGCAACVRSRAASA